MASLFKLFFSVLPEPLFTFELYPRFVELQTKGDTDGVFDLVDSQLPPSNASVLQFLLSFLARVAKHEDVNKMGPANLAIVFSPILLRPREWRWVASLHVLERMWLCSLRCVVFLLQHRDDPEGDKDHY